MTAKVMKVRAMTSTTPRRRDAMRRLPLGEIVSSLLLAFFLVRLAAVELGNVTGFLPEARGEIVACGDKRVRIEAWDDDVSRVWLS